MRLLARITTSAAFLVLASGLFGQAIFRGQNVTSTPPSGPAFVSATAAGSTDASNVTTPPISTVGATLLVASVSFYASGIPLISDSLGNMTWVSLPYHAAGTYGQTRFFYCLACTVGPAQTFSVISCGCYPGLFVQAFSGVTSYIGLTNANGGTLTIQPGSQTPGANNALLVTSFTTHNGDVFTSSIDSGFTITDTLSGVANAFGGSMAYFVQSVAAPVNPTWTQAGSIYGIGATMLQFQ
jgi:hypothetical protein